MARPWWQQLFQRSPRPITRKRPHQTWHLEALEDRLVLSASGPFNGTLARTDIATPQYVLATLPGQLTPQSSSGPVGLTPSQIAQAYGFNAIQFNNIHGDGTGQTIAIIDAYDDPNIQSDLAAFDTQFGLSAPPSFTVVNQTGGTTLPGTDPTKAWELEESLDVEWAHALAPGASIVLVEANSANNSDLDTAVDTARNMSSVSVVSMSYGGSEYSGESGEDAHFITPSGHAGVTFLAATGDSGPPGEYPAYSPTVVAVGGTTLSLTKSNAYSSESAWSSGGGGISQYEGQPGYQQSVVTQTSTARAIPDVAFDASPGSGVAVYDSYNYGTSAPWIQVGGTSVATPCWGALVAIADQDRADNGQGSLDGFSQTLPALYSAPAADFHDVTTGSITNGSTTYYAGTGYDLATGLGSPVANLLVPQLAATGTPATLTWTGGGASSSWSDPNNWGGTAPTAGDTLVFGPGASSVNSVNDFAAGTIFQSLVFTGSGYSVSGNAVVLTGGIDASQATGNNTVGLNISLGGSDSIQTGGSGTTLTLAGTINDHGNTLTVAGGSGAVVLDNTLSGPGGLVESSSGTLTLSGSGGNTFSGTTSVQSGTLLLDETGGPALGGPLTVGGGSSTALAQWLAANQLASGAALTVNSSGTVDLNGNSDTTSSLTLGSGTLQTEAGTLSLTGNITASGTSTVSGNLALPVAGSTVNVATSGTLTVSGVISGPGSLTKTGNGTLILSGANTYSGGTTLSTGTLELGNGAAAGSGILALNSGTLTASGSAQTLSNAVTLGGNVIIGGSLGLTFTGPITLTGSRTLTVNNTTTFSSAVGQSGSTPLALIKSGSGTLLLSVANTYSGGTTLSNGTLELGNSSAAGSGTLTLTYGTLTAAGTAQTITNAVTLGGSVTIGGTLSLTFTGPITLTGNRTLTVNNTTTVSSAIGQSGSTPYSLTKAGSGTLLLSVGNTYTGGTTLSNGTLELGNSAAAGSGTLTLTSGTLTASGSAQTLSNAMTLGGNVTIGGSLDLIFTGSITLTGNRTLTITNTGNTTFSGAIGQSGSTPYSLTKAGSDTLVLSGANTYSGGTTLSNGTLELGNSAAAGTGTLLLTGGTLTASGSAQTLSNAVTLGGNVIIGGSLGLTFTGPITLTGSRTLTVNNTGTTTFSGAVGQSGSTPYSLSKAGSGTLVLSGNNTYTGGTTINAGTLLVEGTQASGTVTVNSTATLGGTGTMGPITVSSGGTLLPGTGSSNPAVLGSGNVTVKSGATFDEVLDGATAGAGGYGQLNVTGTVNLTGSTLSLTLGFTPTIGETFTIINNDGTDAVVGTFKNLPQGGTLTVNNMTFQISYTGGDGNDVVLTRTA